MTKILLVEDDPLIYRMYQKLFTLEGFETEIAENGQEGLDKIASFQPDIILLDIMMPKMDGLELCLRLKKDPETKSIPVVMMTAYDRDIEKLHRGRDTAPAEGYFSKSWAPVELEKMMDQILRRKKAA